MTPHGLDAACVCECVSCVFVCVASVRNLFWGGVCRGERAGARKLRMRAWGALRGQLPRNLCVRNSITFIRKVYLNLGHSNLAEDSVRCVGVPVLWSVSQLFLARAWIDVSTCTMFTRVRQVITFYWKSASRWVDRGEQPQTQAWGFSTRSGCEANKISANQFERILPLVIEWTSIISR